MKIATRQSQAVTIVDLEGRLDSKAVGAVNDEMVSIIQGGAKQIVVNLEKIDFVTSAGLRVLLRSSKLLQGSGGKLKLCNANELVSDILKTAGFDSLLNLYGSEAEAIQSF